MEELPQRAKTVWQIYATASAVGQSAMVFFGANSIKIGAFLLIAVLVALISSFFYVRQYFRHYRYYISDGMIIIKKGTAFKKRHLIYTHEISDITVSENFIQRFFGLCTVWFHMSGHSVKLSCVMTERSDQLKEILDSRY